MNVYRIERDGKFSSGGSYARFTKNGKLWCNLGHVKTSVGRNPFTHGRYKETDEIVEYILVEVSRTSFKDFNDECVKSREESDKIEAERSLKYQKRLLQERLNKLQEEIEALK